MIAYFFQYSPHGLIWLALVLAWAGFLSLTLWTLRSFWWPAFQKRLASLMSQKPERARARELGNIAGDLPRLQASGIHEGAYDQQDELLRLVVSAQVDGDPSQDECTHTEAIFALQGMRTGATGAEPVGFFAVANARGEQSGGQERSRLALRTIGERIFPAFWLDGQSAAVMERLTQGAMLANEIIARQNQHQQVQIGVALTAAFVVGQTVYGIQAGNCRVYRYRRSDGLGRITGRLSGPLSSAGWPPISEEKESDAGSASLPWLGEQPSARISTFVEPLRATDILLLCSESLGQALHEAEIQRIVAVADPSPSHLSALLVQAARNRGGVRGMGLVVVGAEVTGSSETAERDGQMLQELRPLHHAPRRSAS